MTAGPAAPGLRLRRMRWWDVAAASAAEAALFPADPWSPAAFWSELAGVPATRWYVVAEQPGAADLPGCAGTSGSAGLAGYAGLRVVGAEADVQTLAVLPAAQGRGLGRALLGALLDRAAAAGARRVFLEVRADNAPALALYAAAGFARTGLRRRYYPDGADAVLMVRRRAAGPPEDRAAQGRRAAPGDDGRT